MNRLIILLSMILTVNSYAGKSASKITDSSEISISTVTDISELGSDFGVDIIKNNKDIAGIISMVVGGGVMVVGTVASLPAVATLGVVEGGFFIAVVGVKYFIEGKKENIKILIINPDVDLRDIDLLKEEINEVNKCVRENTLNSCETVLKIKEEFGAVNLPNENVNVLELLKLSYEQILLIIKNDGGIKNSKNVSEIIKKYAEIASREYEVKVINGEVIDSRASEKNYYRDFFEEKLYTLLINTKILLK